MISVALVIDGITHCCSLGNYNFFKYIIYLKCISWKPEECYLSGKIDEVFRIYIVLVWELDYSWIKNNEFGKNHESFSYKLLSCFDPHSYFPRKEWNKDLTYNLFILVKEQLWWEFLFANISLVAYIKWNGR